MCPNSRAPLVSVLVPIYQAQPYLRACVDSVLCQTYSNFELILCDDGSSDESGMICEQCAAADSRIIVLHQRNKGNFAARKTLLQAAQGDYVLFVDADDYIDPDTLQQTVPLALEQNSDIVMFGHTNVTDSGETIREVVHHFPEGTMRGDELISVYRLLCTSSVLNYLWDKLIRRSAFESCRSTRPVRDADFKGGDICQLLDVIRNITSFSYIDRPLYFYRQSVIGMGRNFKLNYFSDSRAIYLRRMEFLSQFLPNDPETKTNAEQKYLEALTTRVMSAVHSRRYSYNELHAAFDEERNSAVFRGISQTDCTPGKPVLHRLTLRLFRHRMDRITVLMLRAEQDVLSLVRHRRGKQS